MSLVSSWLDNNYHKQINKSVTRNFFHKKLNMASVQRLIIVIIIPYFHGFMVTGVGSAKKSSYLSFSPPEKKGREGSESHAHQHCSTHYYKPPPPPCMSWLSPPRKKRQTTTTSTTHRYIARAFSSECMSRSRTIVFLRYGHPCLSAAIFLEFGIVSIGNIYIVKLFIYQGLVAEQKNYT